MNTHEEQACQYFLGSEYITEILQPIKSGKEASVYLCQGGEFYDNELLCLKIYKDFSKRSFKNTQSYQEGRFSGYGGREKRAIKSKSEFGKALMQSNWLGSEVEALTMLHDAGINVPKPLKTSNTAILMDYIGDEYQIANQLKDEFLHEKKTKYLFKKIISYIQEMFNLDIIHGDLSAYNILVWKNRPVIIDLPQYVSPSVNSHAFEILHRDVDNICNFFERKGIRTNSSKITNQIWNYKKIFFI